MRTKEFLQKLDHERIVKAIQEAEAKSSGNIRVYLQRGEIEGDALPLAQKQFLKFKMDQTQHRNAVLIFVAPRAQKFAVVGDAGIHQKCGDDLWSRVVKKMSEHFRQEHFTDALVDAIHDLGQVLAEQFPPVAGEKANELPDDVIEG
jgi:uncharacterized membrane protein